MVTVTSTAAGIEVTNQFPLSSNREKLLTKAMEKIITKTDKGTFLTAAAVANLIHPGSAILPLVEN